MHDRRTNLELVGPGHDDELADPRGAYPLEHLLDQQPLLRRPEPRRGAGREHDRRDHLLEIVTLRITTIRVGVPASVRCPSFPIFCTTAMPFVTWPSSA